MPSPSMPIRRCAAILVSLTALAVLAAACGSSNASGSDVPSLNGSSGNAASNTTTTVDQKQAVQEFVACLRGEGLNVADPKVGSDGQIDFRSIFQSADVQPGSDTFRKAQEKCGDKLRNAGFGPSESDQKARQAAQLAFTACLRTQGLTVGDLPADGPGFGPGGRQPGAGGQTGSGASSTTAAGGSGSGAATSSTVAGPSGGPGGGFGPPDGNFRPPTEEERQARIAERLDLDISDPAVSKAFTACNKELTALNTLRGPGGRGGATTTTAG